MTIHEIPSVILFSVYNIRECARILYAHNNIIKFVTRLLSYNIETSDTYFNENPMKNYQL